MIDRFKKGAGSNELTYPLTAAAIAGLKKCDLASPRVGRNHGVPLPAALCNKAARREALAEVKEVRARVISGEFPRAFMEKYYPEERGEFPKEIPELLAREGLSFDNPQGLANVVHMDNPLDLGEAMLSWLLSVGAKKKGANYNVNPFVDLVPGTMADLAVDVNKALREAFEIKWFWGVERPEEVDGDGPEMTAYPEGCPNHPSFPAGHGAAAFASYHMYRRKWDLTPEQDKALFDAAYSWSMARSFAGVHYAVDNLTFAG